MIFIVMLRSELHGFLGSFILLTDVFKGRHVSLFPSLVYSGALVSIFPLLLGILGASSDFDGATKIAKMIMTRFDMSDKASF